MTIMQAIAHIVQKHDKPDTPWPFYVGLALVSNRIDECKTITDLDNAISVGLDLYESGEVDKAEMRCACVQSELLVRKFLEVIKYRMQQKWEQN